MVLDARAKIGIAEIVFYVPVICVAKYLVLFRHGSPRMAWLLLLVFSLIRFAGGIVVILLSNNPGSVGLIIAALALLGTGVVPLVVATLGLLRIIIANSFRESSALRFIVIFCRVLFSVGVAMLVAGGSLEGQYNTPSLSSVGLKLVKAGYIVVLVIFVTLLGFEAYFWTNAGKLVKSDGLILKATCIAMPFLAVRIAYAFLSVFDADNNGLQSKWDVLYGSIAAYVVMALLMEYIVVLIYLAVGVRIPPVGKRVR